MKIGRSRKFYNYIQIARFDHIVKHIFAIPGIVMAYLLRGSRSENPLIDIAIGFVSLVCIASANYVINDYLDRSFDKHHPVKSLRAAVTDNLNGQIIFFEWLLLITIGLAAAYMSSTAMFIIAALFGLQGIIYNVQPFRTKDISYLDVISESVNNPLRFTIGWLMIDPTSLPPISVLLSYHLGGAFLMGAKRLSEYREIVASHGKNILIKYRKSFKGYSEMSLTVSCFIYAMLSLFFIAVFLIKYRIEYLLLIPWVTLLFGYYLMLSMSSDGVVQNPEQLYKKIPLMVILGLLILAFILTTVIDIPWMSTLSEQTFIEI